MKRIQKKGYNYHHLKPRSRGGQSIDSNMCFLKIKKHNALHRIYGNSTPRQILKMLRHFEEDFKIVFGDVTFAEAVKIFERLLQMKQGPLE
jgi:hypothetical protein